MNPKTQSFEVEAVFDKCPETLYPGLSAEVNILIAQKEKALLIPVSCLEKNNIVKTTDGEVTVKTGLKNLEFVEILEGLNEKSQILIPNGK
jgi:multidrug efflux pump subunit AcrA (membrane-fusion protein)